MNKKLIAVIVCLSILFTSFVSPAQIAAKKTKLKLNKKKVTMYVGKTVLLKVKGTKKKVKWKSNRKKIAAVSKKGKVTAKKKGSAKITAKVGKKKLVCRVTVRNRAALSDDADQSYDSVNQGGSDVSAAPGSSASTSFTPSGGDASATVKPGDFGGAVTKKPDHTENTDMPKPQETAAANTAKPQETTAVNTAKPQETAAANTAKPQETAAVNTAKPQETTAVNTAKPQKTAAANTAKPQKTAAVNTAKPQETAAVNTMKPQETTAVNTAKPQETTAVNTAKPQETAAANTAEPQPSEEAAATERPQVPIVSKEASFETGTDGFTARGNARIQTAEDGYNGKCLCVSGRTSASDGAGYEVEGDLLAGESYAVWAYIKMESGTDTVKVMYQTGEGSDSIHELKTAEVSDQWVKVMGTITLPEGFTKLDVWFEASDPAAVFYIDEVSVSEVISIKDAYAGLVKELGMCINPDKLRDADALEYVKKHYTSITMENDMKPDAILRAWNPSIISTESAKEKRDYIIPDSYAEDTIPELNFATVDEALKIARKNGLKIRFHVLVWHSQTPEWFFKEGYSQDENQAYVSEETMNARMEWYIRTVMNHVYTLDGGAYRSVVYAWDVANEYLHNDADKNWSAVYGNREGNLESRPPYIKRAFQLAYEMLEKFSLQDSVSLFYNDFNTYWMVTDQIVDMIHWINEEKKICSGIGMQSHIGVNFPSVEHYINTLKRFVNEGFEVQITELDVACDEELLEKDQMAAYEQQAEYVGELMENIVEIQETMDHPITGLTWWGLCDSNSWVKTHALLFGKGGIRDAKPAYFAFINAVKPDSKPAPTPTPAPPTAPPVADYDFIDGDSYKNESPGGAESYINEDGSLTIIFKNQYAAFNFYLPENARNCKGYQAVELEYTSTGGDLGHSLFDMNAEENGDSSAGKHSDWGRRIIEHPDGINTLTFAATADCYGGCIRGLQIFNPNEMKDGKTITITVKSIKFTGLVSDEPITPTAAPTAEPTAAATAEPPDVSVPSGYTGRNESVAGTVEDITYDSTVIKEGETVQRKAKVVLPKGYTEDKKYPVVYMQHGIFGDETTLYGDGAQYVVWNAIANGDAEEMIVVFPNACANEEGKGDGFNIEHYRAYDNFINDLDQCLMPYINEHYSTLTGRKNTAVCGYSMGGRVSLHIGFTLQDKFGYIGGFCPTFGILEYENYGVHEDGLFTPETFTLQEKYMNDTLVLIAAGSNDTIVRTEPKRYSDTLTANGVPHIYYETMGGEDEKGDGAHGPDVYKHGLYNFLNRIFNHAAAVKPSPTPGITVTASPEYTVDFKTDLKRESGNNAKQDVLEDGTADVTFGNYEGVHYILPNTPEMKAAKYRYVTVTYEGKGDEVEVYLYDGKTDLDAASIHDLGDNKKASAVKLKAADGETSVIYSFTDEQPDSGFFRGIQLFHWEGSETKLNIKSIVFSKNKPAADGWTSLPVSEMSEGEQGDAEVALNGMEQVTVPLPQKLEGKGKQVEVTVNGTLAENSDGFRIWLSQGTSTASDQYHFTKANGVGFGGQGDGGLEFKTGPFSITCVLTVGNNNEDAKLETADRLLLKAPAYGGKLTGVTITDIQIREAS